MTKGRIPLIIDTDPGIDDAAAIFWILSKGIFDVKALIVTHGNVGLKACTQNAIRLLEYAGRTDIPVYAGAAGPILRPRINASFAHGSDGMGDTRLPLPLQEKGEGHGANRIIEIAKASKKPVAILAIGPVTNIALAVLMEPELKKYIGQIVFMGGAVFVPGNYSPVASFNAAADPEAAQIVYRSGIPVVQIGLDVCNKLCFSREDFRRLAESDTPMADLMCKMARFRLDKIGVQETESVARKGGIALNDVAAAGFLVNPQWYTLQWAVGDVETEGSCAGQTILKFNYEEEEKPNVCFAAAVDSEAVVREWVDSLSSQER